jgi:hypothetical protein
LTKGLGDFIHHFDAIFKSTAGVGTSGGRFWQTWLFTNCAHIVVEMFRKFEKKAGLSKRRSGRRLIYSSCRQLAPFLDRLDFNNVYVGKRSTYLELHLEGALAIVMPQSSRRNIGAR